jgi:NADH-quinone oxidoreductase subunit L
VFHGEERMDNHAREHLHESPWVVTIPLMLLAIPSLVIGWPTIGPLLFGEFFTDVIFVLPVHDVLGELGAEYHGPLGFLLHGLSSPVLYIAAAGVVVAWYLYLKNPALPGTIKARFEFLYQLLANKYYLDDFNQKVFARGAQIIGGGLWKGGDVAVIDGFVINGGTSLIGRIAGALRVLQTGYLYHYAFVMVIGLCLFTGWLIWLR